MSKLTSLNYMLTHNLAPPGEMASHIETNGIYALDDLEKYKHFGPDTPQAKAALAGIAVFLEHENNPPPDDYADWYMQGDPTYVYGWPDGGVPDFGKAEFWLWNQSHDDLLIIGKLFRKDIVTIGRLLLLNQATPGEIKKAIDRVGIYGFDNYASLIQIEMASPAGLEVQDALSTYANHFIQGKLPPNSIFNARGYKFFGWPADQLPDFKNLPSVPPATAQANVPAAAPAVPALPTQTVPQDDDPKVSPQGAKSFHIIIASLLSMIRGDMTGRPHPDWDSQNQLIAAIEEKLKKTYGTSDSNLRKKFAAANKVRPLLGLSALDDDGNPVG